MCVILSRRLNTQHSAYGVDRGGAGPAGWSDRSATCRDLTAGQWLSH